MDRTQYGKVTVADTYKPYDLVCKKKPLPGYALLADLQSNLSKNSSHQQATISNGPCNTNKIIESTSTCVTTTQENQNHIDKSKNSLQNGFSKHEEASSEQQNNYSHPYLHNNDTQAQNMYRHETREEIRTETHSSGPDPSPSQPRATTNNLSELDTLLHDLNKSKTKSVSSTTDHTVVNGVRPSVDSLLDELNSVSHTEMKQDSKYKYGPCYNSTTRQATTATASASNATKELDDLMDSLSDFKKNGKLRSPAMVRKLINPPTVVHTQYAKPKKRSPSPPPKLDSMLESLTVHMTEQGVTTTQKGCCCACDKPIVGQVITALGKTWHPEHFTCAHCQQELGTKNFFERDGKPYCETDYHNLFSPKCAYCNGPILDKCVTALDKTWHPEHFFCAHCGNTFGEEGFHEKNGKAYCKEDYFNMFAPKCGGCNNPIMENYISALNGQWHPDCFVCRDCHQPFNGGSFFDHEGFPYCETHYHAKRGSLCAGCNKPITGRCITAMFRKWHPEHFVCAFCLQQLNKGTFKEQNDKPYCHPCFDKLYG